MIDRTTVTCNYLREHTFYEDVVSKANCLVYFYRAYIAKEEKKREPLAEPPLRVMVPT